MEYGNQTPTYALRSPMLGDFLSPSEEFRNAQIIENQLYGAIRAHSGGHGIIRSGNWQLVPSGLNYKAILLEVKSEGKPAIEGFLNQIYYFSNEALEWDGLLDHTTYYLYIQLVESTELSTRLHKKVVTGANTTGIIPADALLVAVLYVDEPGSSQVDKNPIGRINIPILGDHIIDNQDPHGPILNQSFIITSGLETQGYLYYRALEVDNLLISGNGLISGNLTVLGNFTVSGDVVVFGNIHFNEIDVDYLSCSNLVVGQLQIASGLDVYGQTIFRDTVNLSSGVTIDGLDPSEAIGLIDGSNADHLHTHVLGSMGVSIKSLYYSPDYRDTILSGGATSGVFGFFMPVRAYEDNYYDWMSNNISGGAAYTLTKIRLPQDFERLDSIDLRYGVGDTESGNNIMISLYDKDNTALVCPRSQLSGIGNFADDTLFFSGGNLVPGKPITMVTRFWSFSGVHTYLGDIAINYVPLLGERLQFEWSQDGAVAGPTEYFDALRSTPYELRVDKVIATQSVGLSGVSVFSIMFGATGTTPENLLLEGEKPTINFNDSGASFQSDVKTIYNRTIPANSLLAVNIDNLASGSSDVAVQLIAYRI